MLTTFMALQTPSSTAAGKGDEPGVTGPPALLTLQGFLSGLDSEKKKRPKLLGKQFKKLISAAAPSTPRSTARISANSDSTTSIFQATSSVQVVSQELAESGRIHAKDSSELFSSSKATSPLHATLLSQDSPREESISSKILERDEYSGLDETLSLSSKTGNVGPVEHVKEAKVSPSGKTERDDEKLRYIQKPPTAHTRLTSPRSSIEQETVYKSSNLESLDEHARVQKNVSQSSSKASNSRNLAKPLRQYGTPEEPFEEEMNGPNPERDTSSLENDEYASWVQANLSPSRKISIPKTGKALRDHAMQGEPAAERVELPRRDHELSRYTQKLPKLKTRRSPVRNGDHAMELHSVDRHEYSGVDQDPAWSRSKTNSSRIRRPPVYGSREHDNHVVHSRIRSTPARDEYSGVDESLSSNDSGSRRGRLVRGSAHGDYFRVDTRSPRQQQYRSERDHEYLGLDENVSLHSKSSGLRTGKVAALDSHGHRVRMELTTSSRPHHQLERDEYSGVESTISLTSKMSGSRRGKSGRGSYKGEHARINMMNTTRHHRESRDEYNSRADEELSVYSKEHASSDRRRRNSVRGSHDDDGKNVRGRDIIRSRSEYSEKFEYNQKLPASKTARDQRNRRVVEHETEMNRAKLHERDEQHFKQEEQHFSGLNKTGKRSFANARGAIQHRDDHNMQQRSNLRVDSVDSRNPSVSRRSSGSGDVSFDGSPKSAISEHETVFSSSHSEGRSEGQRKHRARSRTSLTVTSQKEWRSHQAAAVRYPNTRSHGELDSTGDLFAEGRRMISGSQRTDGQETESPRDHRDDSHLNYSPDESSFGGEVGNNFSVSDIGNVSRSASSAALSSSGSVTEGGDNWVTEDGESDKGRHAGGAYNGRSDSSSSRSSFTTTSRVPDDVPQLPPRSRSSSKSKFQKRTKSSRDASIQPSNSSSFKERPAHDAHDDGQLLGSTSSVNLVDSANRQVKKMKRHPAAPTKLVVLLGKYGNKKGLQIAGLQQSTSNHSSNDPSHSSTKNDTSKPTGGGTKQNSDLERPAEREYESLNTKEAVAVFQDEVARMMMSKEISSNRKELTDVEDFFTGYMRLHSPIYLKMLQDFFRAVCLDCYKRPLAASAFKITDTSKLQNYIMEQQQQQQHIIVNHAAAAAAAATAPGPRHSSSGASLESDCAAAGARPPRSVLKKHQNAQNFVAITTS